MKLKFTEARISVLSFIMKYKRQYSYSPTQSEIAKGTNRCRHNITRILTDLERLGAIRRSFNKTRGIELIRPAKYDLPSQQSESIHPTDSTNFYPNSW